MSRDWWEGRLDCVSCQGPSLLGKGTPLGYSASPEPQGADHLRVVDIGQVTARPPST